MSPLLWAFAAFVLALYAFVWAICRSAARYDRELSELLDLAPEAEASPHAKTSITIQNPTFTIGEIE